MLRPKMAYATYGGEGLGMEYCCSRNYGRSYCRSLTQANY
jgi:hypothetical protein